MHLGGSFQLVLVEKLPVRAPVWWASCCLMTSLKPAAGAQISFWRACQLQRELVLLETRDERVSVKRERFGTLNETPDAPGKHQKNTESGEVT